jgi:methylmalonyl-CoA carboxyltransferase large subunit
MSHDAQLTDQVKSLLTELKGLKLEVKRLKAKTAVTPEDHVVAIAAAVAAYLGEDGTRRQARYPASPVWSGNTRRAQHAHHPLYS